MKWGLLLRYRKTENDPPHPLASKTFSPTIPWPSSIAGVCFVDWFLLLCQLSLQPFLLPRPRAIFLFFNNHASEAGFSISLLPSPLSLLSSSFSCCWSPLFFLASILYFFFGVCLRWQLPSRFRHLVLLQHCVSGTCESVTMEEVGVVVKSAQFICNDNGWVLRRRRGFIIQKN